MSMKIESGLFSLEFTDHYAVLGVPIDADPKDIRKQYLKLARRLHPDSTAAESDLDRQRAQECLSKLVNPAYEYLKDERNFTEYQLMLKLVGQKALKQQETIVLTSDAARRLAGTIGSIENPYREALKQLAEQQYQHLDQMPEVTAAISELNLIYLMRRGKSGPPVTDGSAKEGGNSISNGTGIRKPPGPAAPKETLLDRSLRRAREHIAQGNSTEAIRELRDAVKSYPKEPKGHAELGLLYASLKQTTYAKIHLRKALELGSQDPRVTQVLKRVDPEGSSGAPAAAGQSTAKPGSPARPDPRAGKPNSKDNNSGGGLFNFFGKKK